MDFASIRKDNFHVITMISNPVRFNSRYNLFRKFERHILEFTENLWVCELQLGDRPFVITDPKNKRHLQLRTWDEMWHKENCLNLLIERLPSDWETVAWLDADIEFTRKDWVEETLHQLQVYKVVQCFETAIDLSPSGSALSIHRSFMSQYIKGGCYHPETPYQHWHPGFAWAARREAIDEMGGLYDRSILGSGDRNMALALIGKVDLSYNQQISEGYKRDLRDYERECLQYVNLDVGYVSGNINHYWHGKKKDRRYADRWEILVNQEFDPDRDIKKDWQGVYQITTRKPHLRDAIRQYFRARNEDSIDLV